jgi:16S rRNA A1518/A1519 N6-dimethyltransferase RsmA/KsgA/DIM1 with predicted DNA glycosylase/AP lyase activity
LPAPKVDSAIIHLEIHKKSAPDYIPTLQAMRILSLAKQAFSSKRKKLSNTLPGLKEKLLKLSLQDLRPQTLSIEDWKKLLN